MDVVKTRSKKRVGKIGFRRNSSEKRRWCVYVYIIPGKPSTQLAPNGIRHFIYTYAVKLRSNIGQSRCDGDIQF